MTRERCSATPGENRPKNTLDKASTARWGSVERRDFRRGVWKSGLCTEEVIRIGSTESSKQSTIKDRTNPDCWQRHGYMRGLGEVSWRGNLCQALSIWRGEFDGGAKGWRWGKNEKRGFLKKGKEKKGEKDEKQKRSREKKKKGGERWERNNNDGGWKEKERKEEKMRKKKERDSLRLRALTTAGGKSVVADWQGLLSQIRITLQSTAGSLFSENI